MRRAMFTSTVRRGMKIALARASTSMTPEERAQPDVAKALAWMDQMKDWKSNRKPAPAKKVARRRRKAG